MKMKAYAMLKINSVGWIDADKPTAGPLDAIVKPIAMSPCSSDVHTVEGSLGERTMVLGHEAAGEVVEVGSGVKDFKPGDRVVVPAVTPVWRSMVIQEGYPSSHSPQMLYGLQFGVLKPGVNAEFFHVNDADMNLAHMPKELTIDQAVMISDMMPTGFYGAEMADIHFGHSVLVIGIGPVGLMAVAGAALRGAGRILAVGSRPDCVALAKEYGATDIINYKNGDIVKQVMELTKGKGVDRAIIAGGTGESLGQAITALKAGGTVSNVNYYGAHDNLTIPRPAWGYGMSDKTIKGGYCPGGRAHMERLVSMVLAGRVDPGRMITHRFEGLEKIDDAFKLMQNKPKDLIKPIVYVEK